jgi:hypothetical protein
LLRLALRACPADFRRAHGAEVLGTVIDRCRHGHEPAGRVVVQEVVDVVRAASRMRWENPMTRTVILAVAITAGTVGALVGGPLRWAALAGAVLIAVAMTSGLRRRRPAATPVGGPARWWRWTAAGAVLVAAAVAIPLVDGDELSEPWWAIAAVLLVGGLVAGSIGLVTAARRAAGGWSGPPPLPPGA